MSRWTSASLNFLPIKRLTEKTVVLGLTIICLLATSPTMCFCGSTTEGMMFLPSAEWITLGLPASTTATTEFVVPKSIPITLGILVYIVRACRELTSRLLSLARRILWNLLFKIFFFFFLLFLNLPSSNHNLRRSQYLIIYFVTFCQNFQDNAVLFAF